MASYMAKCFSLFEMLKKLVDTQFRNSLSEWFYVTVALENLTKFAENTCDGGGFWQRSWTRPTTLSKKRPYCRCFSNKSFRRTLLNDYLWACYKALALFSPTFPFHTPENIRKRLVFSCFLKGIKKRHYEEKG